MSRYYYLVNALPPLQLGKKPEVSYEEADEMILMNLSSQDTDLLVEFQRPIDIRNIRALWLREPLDSRGNFLEQELAEALLVQEGLPLFVLDFLQRYDSLEERLRYFPSLMASLYGSYAKELRGFNRAYYQLEREIRLVLTALRAKMMGRSLIHELQFEDPTDPFIAELLVESREFLVPQEYEELKVAFLENRSNPKELYRAILTFRMKRIQELEIREPFAIDQILGYLSRLLLVEDWQALDEQRGRAALEQVG
jgi:hypothetical protein